MKRFNELTDQEKFECVNLFYDFLLNSITDLGSPIKSIEIDYLCSSDKKIAYVEDALLARKMISFIKNILHKYQFSEMDSRILKKAVEIEKKCDDFIERYYEKIY